MQKRNGYFILSMWWFILLAVMGGLIVFFTSDRERISMDENRVLQNAPDFSLTGFFGGEYAADFERFLADSVPGRNALISASNTITNLIAMNTSEDEFYLDTTMTKAAEFGGEQTDASEADNTEESANDDSSASEKNSENDVNEQNGAKFELVKRDGGSTVIYTYSEENLKRSAENIQKVVDLIPEDGKVYLTFVPFPVIAFRFTDSPKVYCGWRCNHIEKLDQLTSDRVKCFDSLRILEPHMLAGERMFLHFSHQWHIHGAYYVYSEMIRSQGLTPTPYEEYEYKINHPPRYSEDSFELLYPLAPAHNYQVSHINQKKEYPLMYYIGADNASYLYGNQRPWHTVITGFHTGRRAMIFGDCFNLSFSTFLLPYYDELHFTDVRYNLFDREELGTSVADMMQRNSIDDVYIVFSEAHGVNSSTFLRAFPQHLY